MLQGNTMSDIYGGNVADINITCSVEWSRVFLIKNEQNEDANVSQK